MYYIINVKTLRLDFEACFSDLWNFIVNLLEVVISAGRRPSLPGPLDGGVDGEHDDQQQQAVEHAQDGRPALLRGLGGSWRN